MIDYCEVVHDSHYPVQSAGIWADAVRRREPVVFNDYAAYPNKHKLPEGHSAFQRLISVPVIEHGRVVMLAGVGNKPVHYNELDVETVQLVANEVWRLSQHGRAMEKLRLGDRVLHDTAEGVAITDAMGNLTSVNPAFEQITGYSESDILGKNPRLLKSGRHDDDFYREMWSTLKQAGHWRGEIWNRRKNGEIFPEWLTISAIHGPREQVTHYVAVFSDISHIKEAQQQIDFLARHDGLTRLPNRTLFMERLEHALQRGQAETGSLAVLFVDLDRFNAVNDNFGHPVGDELLNQIALRLGATLRGSDTLARLGGDEFALLLEERADAHRVATLARQLLLALAAPITIAGRSLVITASIGAWVLRTACAQIKRWDASGFEVPTVAVNLSVKQLERGDFVGQVRAALAGSLGLQTVAEGKTPFQPGAISTGRRPNPRLGGINPSERAFDCAPRVGATSVARKALSWPIYAPLQHKGPYIRDTRGIQVNRALPPLTVQPQPDHYVPAPGRPCGCSRRARTGPLMSAARRPRAAPANRSVADQGNPTA